MKLSGERVFLTSEYNANSQPAPRSTLSQRINNEKHVVLHQIHKKFSDKEVIPQ